MKTKLTLLVATLVIVLFGTGCATTPKEKTMVKITANNPVNPNIYINDVFIGNTEFDHIDVMLEVGEHTVRAEREGWESVEKVITVLPKGESIVQQPNGRTVQQTFRFTLKRKGD
jgi:hypothetical protein